MKVMLLRSTILPVRLEVLIGPRGAFQVQMIPLLTQRLPSLALQSVSFGFFDVHDEKR